ncbi:hypothetical protein [Thalassobius sp. Cn5-15]|uniref:hypothetical protein n=1 Tax=Thalassobius sp. Cn5-15 TaxID=2917763 RepID=UPI001EF342CE|nr:hypothetical protein [Thalassobius sp. Cn5-15]MCG7494161.1 hypothetical protein [Thalassobius sp. Cn5-15]
MTVPTSTHVGTPATRRVDLCGFDAFELGLLPVMRHLLTTFTQPESQAWIRAQTIAVERWGETVGLASCHRMQALLRCLHDCRDDLSVIDPLDIDQRGRVTVDEETCLWMLHYMRRDNTPKARDAVDRLTHGRMDPHLVREGLKFAARFPAAGVQTAPRIEKPRLTLVQGAA